MIALARMKDVELRYFAQILIRYTIIGFIFFLTAPCYGPYHPLGLLNQYYLSHAILKRNTAQISACHYTEE